MHTDARRRTNTHAQVAVGFSSASKKKSHPLDFLRRSVGAGKCDEKHHTDKVVYCFNAHLFLPCPLTSNGRPPHTLRNSSPHPELNSPYRMLASRIASDMRGARRLLTLPARTLKWQSLGFPQFPRGTLCRCFQMLPEWSQIAHKTETNAHNTSADCSQDAHKC